MNKSILLLPLLALMLTGCKDNPGPDDNNTKDAWTTTEKQLLTTYHGYSLPFLKGASITLNNDDVLVIESDDDDAEGLLIEYNNLLLDSHSYTNVKNATHDLDVERDYNDTHNSWLYGSANNEKITLYATTIEKEKEPDPDPDPDPVEKTVITPNVTYLKLCYQEEFQLNVSVQPLAAANKGVTYEVTSQASFISVTDNGLIKIFDCGTATYDKPHNGAVTITSVYDTSVKVVVKIDYYNGYNREEPTEEAVSKSLVEVYDTITNLTPDQKGTVFSTTYTRIHGVYLFHIDNQVPIITDGVNILQTHSIDDKITNNFTEGASYYFYGYPSRYIYKPGFSIVDFEKAPAVPDYYEGKELDNTNTYTATEIRSLKVSDLNQDPKYQKMITFEGYLVYGVRSGDYLFGFHDTGVYSIPSSDNSTNTRDVRFSVEVKPYGAVLEELFDYVSDRTEQIKINIKMMLSVYVSQQHTWAVYPLLDTLVAI